MKNNPFDKFLGPEDHLHRQVADYLNIQYRNILWTHAANEGKRSPYARFKAKILGMKAGVPDILIFEPRSLKVNGTDTLKFVGLAIELKAGKNKVTPAQFDWILKLKQRHWVSVVCYSFEETKKIIDEYLK